MKPTHGDFPVACRLSDSALRERETTFLAEFKSLVIATEELADGYVFQLPGDRECVAVVFELTVAERECCPFLTFALAAQPNMGPLVLRVTGPAGTKDFLKNHFCNSEESRRQ